MLIALGLFEFMVASLVTGVWTVFIGWFLLTAAHSEERRILTRQSLAGVRVADAMTAHPRTAPGGITVEDFIHSYLLGDRHSAYPVEGPSGTIVGLITLAQLRLVAARGNAEPPWCAMPQCQWIESSLPPHMSRLPFCLSAWRQATAIERWSLHHGGVVGIVTASDISRLIDVRALDVPRRADRAL